VGSRRSFCSAILIASLAGCAGTWSSGRPIYPDGWPLLQGSSDCPDLSGTYRAISDEAGPLRYRPGEHPREMFLFVTHGKPEPLPPLGRRILPWHLAGVFGGDAWNTLEGYAAVLDTTHPDADSGWVRVTTLPHGTIGIRAGRDDHSLLELALRKEAHGRGRYTSGIYQCEDGAVVVIGAFPPPPVENPAGQNLHAGAKFRFFRAVDGSLVALEVKHADVVEGNLEFAKWWRWPRIDQGQAMERTSPNSRPSN
jgi:hypothetical protein